MRMLLPVAAMALFSCYSPNLSGVQFSCTGDGKPDDCPSGYACIQSICRLVGEPPGGTLAPGKAAGCASMSGYDVAKDGNTVPVFACPGAFSGTTSSNATTLCASGYSICQNTIDIDLAKCNAAGMPGFYIGDKLGEHNSTMAACGTQNNLIEDYWVGCGNPSNIRLVSIPQTCNGFLAGRDCDNGTGSEFNCNGDNQTPIEDIVSTNPLHGVLCCK